MTLPEDSHSGRSDDDPDLRRMLATHMHCGEPMHLIQPSELPLWAAAPETATVSTTGQAMETLTYRCACGFTLDHRPE
jgi:hypothetical protein